MAFGMTNIVGELGIKVTGYTSELSNSLKSVTADLKGFSRNAELTSKISHAAFMGVAAAATAVAAGLALSVKNAAEFEKGMSNISTLIDTNTESMEEMGNAVLGVSKRTPVLTSDLTSALYDIRSAGVSAGDAMSVLEKSAQLGVAGLGSTSEAVDLVTSSMNAFKLEGEEAEQVYGYVFNTVKSGKTTITELSQGFGAVAGTVASANIELPEYLSAVAALTTTGLPAAQAHTQLKAAIAGVTRDSKELSTVLNNLGAKTFKDLIRQEGGMVNAFKAITEQVDGNDAAILKLFGSTEAYNAVVQLSGDLNETFTDTLLSMEEGTNNLSAAFEKQKATTSAQFQLLKNNFNTLSIQVGSKLLPTLNRVLTATISFIDSIGETVAQIRDWISESEVVQGVLIGLGVTLTVFAATTIPTAIAAIGGLAVSLAGVVVAAAPFLAIAAAITIAVAGIYIGWKKYGDKITEAVRNLWESVKTKTKAFWEWIQPYAETALRAVAFVFTGGLSEVAIIFFRNWEEVKTATLDFWEWLQPYLETTMRTILAVVTLGMSEIAIFAIQNWEEIKTKTVAAWEFMRIKATEIWNAVTDFFVGIWKKIKGVFNAGLDAVDRAWTTTWDGIKNFAENTWTAIIDLVSDGIETVADLFYGGVNIIGNAWNAIWDGLANVVGNVFESVKSKVSGILSWVQRAIDKINIFKSEQASMGGAGGSWSIGGFTFGDKHKVAGVVHGGEWVAPAWMVDKYAGVISQLEGVRTRGYSQGGMVGANTTHNNQRTVHQSITQNIREGVDFSIAAREMAWRARFT